MFTETDPDVIESNGQEYFVGYDDYGWFTIVAAESHPETGELEIAEWDSPASFPPSEAGEIANIINQG